MPLYGVSRRLLGLDIVDVISDQFLHVDLVGGEIDSGAGHRHGLAKVHDDLYIHWWDVALSDGLKGVKKPDLRQFFPSVYYEGNVPSNLSQMCHFGN